MTIEKFNSLDNEEEKLAATLQNGECIGLRKEATINLTLYQVDSFYVEISSSIQEDVLRFCAFTSIDKLKPYLEEIDITALLKS